MFFSGICLGKVLAFLVLDLGRQRPIVKTCPSGKSLGHPESGDCSSWFMMEVMTVTLPELDSVLYSFQSTFSYSVSDKVSSDEENEA